MTEPTLPDSHLLNSSAEVNLKNQQSLQQAQEDIYQFLRKLVNGYSPETVLLEFKHLFIFGNSNVELEGLQALYTIIRSHNEEEFRYTLKRACYILVNNWAFQRKYNHIQELIQILAEAKETHPPLSPQLKILRSWIINFVDGEDYQQLKLFASPRNHGGYWIHRYTSYLLVPQYLDSRNPKEQRELARELSKRLKEKYKIDLAMYTARCDSTPKKEEIPNPTKLGDGGIRLIKKVISRNTLFDYSNQAHLFLQQTRDLNYKQFKLRLHNYLCFYLDNQKFLEALKTKLNEKLENLYESHQKENLSVDLLLRTSRQIIGWLTTEDGREPSYLFVLLTTQGNTLTLVIILLKIVLICQYVRTHLEVCIAQLIHYYEKFSEKECQWFINFLEIFNIVFAIYTEDIKYNLVKIKDKHLDSQRVTDLDAYRVFSQFKGVDLRANELKGADLRNSDLSAADLREANLCEADLTQADLSLAKLSRANMSHAILNEAELIAADLNEADLSFASLISARLRHADLSLANLSRANLCRATLNASALSSANLREADLQHTDLRYANLSHANLSGVKFKGADLSNADLRGANLSGANLQSANLSNANLQDANLIDANLNHADLESVNLQSADLSGASLRHVRLNYANLSHADLSGTDLSHAEMSEGKLIGTDLSDTLLRHVNLSGADLREANLIGANLYSANLLAANLEDTQFGEDSEVFGITQELVYSKTKASY